MSRAASEAVKSSAKSRSKYRNFAALIIAVTRLHNKKLRSVFGLLLPKPRGYISNVPGNGPLVASASITANEFDPVPANNVFITSVAIAPALTVTGLATAATGTVVSYLLGPL